MEGLPVDAGHARPDADQSRRMDPSLPQTARPVAGALATFKPLLVAATILNRPTCAPCTAALVEWTEVEVRAAVASLAPSYASKTEVGTCWRCRMATELHSLARPS